MGWFNKDHNSYEVVINQFGSYVSGDGGLANKRIREAEDIGSERKLTGT